MIRKCGQEKMRQLRFPPSAVVAVHGLVQVFLKLGRGDSMERAEQESLEIRDGGVHLRQPFVDFRRGRGSGIDLEALLERQDPVLRENARPNRETRSL